MMFLGIAAGILSAILQSCSYVASALFLKRHANPREMLFYSQAVQAIFALPLFLLLMPASAWHDMELWRANTIWLGMFCVTQLSMFQTQEHVEPSKLATWLGLKIAVLAVLAVICPVNGESVCAMQWVAIALMLVAVRAINATGGMNPGWRGGLWIAVFVVVASFCDREQVIIMSIFMRHGLSLFASSLLTLALGYLCFGAASAGFFVWRAWQGESPRQMAQKLRDATPFATFWFTAMMAIYFCYGELGPVFGNVVQSTRAIIAVCVAFIAGRLLSARVEEEVSRTLWLRRAAAAALMTFGIVLYSLFR